jgi:hypothetical protein
LYPLSLTTGNNAQVPIKGLAGRTENGETGEETDKEENRKEKEVKKKKKENK